MGVGKAFQNLTGSLTGNNVKAVLCIRKVKSSNINQENNEGIDAVVEDPESAEQDSLDLNSELLAKAENSLKGKASATYSDIKDAADDYDYIALEVQYNPTTLRLDSMAGKQMNFNGTAANTDLKQFNSPSSTTLSFELLFDDVNNMDAFMLGDNPLTGMTASNIANSVTSMVKNGAGSGYSVQRQIEGLLSLLAVPAARNVIFFWGDMSFHGEVTEVQATYTMFNKKGKPVRGKVQMSIRQGDKDVEDEDKKKKVKKYDTKYWDDAFDEVFTDSGSGSVLGTVNKFTNNSLLNLKL